MQITFNLPHVFYPGASKVDNAYALRVLLDTLVNLNLAYLRTHKPPGLYQSGVRYGRTRIWEPIPALFLPNKQRESLFNPFWVPMGEKGGDKKGDCKSLATARIAELQNEGIEAKPVFRFAKRQDDSGALDFHILVQVDRRISKTGWEDPSRILGMGKEEVQRFGPIVDLLALTG
jgi:hypothetical protein